MITGNSLLSQPYHNLHIQRRINDVATVKIIPVLGVSSCLLDPIALHSPSHSQRSPLTNHGVLQSPSLCRSKSTLHGVNIRRRGDRSPRWHRDNISYSALRNKLLPDPILAQPRAHPLDPRLYHLHRRRAFLLPINRLPVVRNRSTTHGVGIPFRKPGRGHTY